MTKNCKILCCSNTILWVVAIIASAILEAPKILSVGILTPLALISIYINGTFVKKLDNGE